MLVPWEAKGKEAGEGACPQGVHRLGGWAIQVSGQLLIAGLVQFGGCLGAQGRPLTYLGRTGGYSVRVDNSKLKSS